MLGVIRRAPFWIVPVALTFFVYRPITGCYFLADDWPTLQTIVNGDLLRFALEPAGGHVYVLRNLVWWLLYETVGPRPDRYFQLVLALHVVNVGLLFAFLRRLCGPHLACFGAALWGVSPMNEGTLGWFSVYGQVLTATLLLVVLVDLAGVAVRSQPVGPARTLAWTTLLVMASTCFGIGVAFAIVFPAVAWLVLGSRLRPAAVLPLAVLPLIVAVGYLEIHRVHAALYRGGADNARLVQFALMRDWENVGQMLRHLLTVGSGGLLVGLVEPVAKYPAAPFTVAAVGYAAALPAAVWLAPPRVRRWMLACGVLALAAYGIIAAGRGSLYAATPTAAYGAGAGRYHYVAPVPLAVLLCLALREISSRVQVAKLRTPILVIVVAGMIGLWARSGWTIDTHESVRRQASRRIGEISQALRARPVGTPVYLRNRGFAPAMLQGYFAGSVSLFVIFFRGDWGPVYFVEPSDTIRASVPPESPIANLMVPSDATQTAGAPPLPVALRRQ